MEVLILGASGFIGQHIITALCQSGHTVTALTRQRTPTLDEHSPITWIRTDLSDTTLLETHQIDAVINCLGAFSVKNNAGFDEIHCQCPMAWFQRCEQLGIRTVIQISALGVETCTESVFLSSKKKLDDRLQEMNLDWTILRPSIVFGPGEKSMAFFKSLALFPWLPLVRQGQTQLQPIFVDDLAEAVVHVLEDSTWRHKVIPAVGPKPLSWAELISLHRRWMGKTPPKILNLPQWAIRLLGYCGEIVHSPFISRQSLSMIERDNVDDASVLPCVLKRPLMSIHRYSTLHPIHHGLGGYWELWLTPFLRIMLALMWIVTGYISWFVFPHDQSHEMLIQSGVPVTWVSFALPMAALMDVLLGLALLVRYQLTAVIIFQLVVIAGYTIVISWGLVEYWFHPFGPLLKNLPIFAATALLLALEKKR